jgi:hypothetical protein
MTAGSGSASSWDAVRSWLCELEPDFFDLEPGGAVALTLDDEDGWLLEVTPDGRLICQVGTNMEDVKSLVSDGTCEDVGTDELAKQARFFLQRLIAARRPTFLGAGFEEKTDMNEDYVAMQFQRVVNLEKPEELEATVRWCKQQFAKA